MDAYLEQIERYYEPYGVRIFHYCLMHNHVHLLIRAADLSRLSKFMHSVQRGYHHYYRKKYTQFGHLFQGRYKSLPIDDEKYLLECGRYIERNPVAAKIVSKPGEWEYSSYSNYAEGRGVAWVQLSPAYLGLAPQESDRRGLYKHHVEITRPYDEVLNKQI